VQNIIVIEINIIGWFGLLISFSLLLLAVPFVQVTMMVHMAKRPLR